jgi:hypothetical protein
MNAIRKIELESDKNKGFNLPELPALNASGPGIQRLPVTYTAIVFHLAGYGILN